MLSRAIETIYRRDGGRILAGLIRRFGSFDIAEEAFQDACAKALEVWPAEGLPKNPPAWLTTVAQRRAIDLLRRERRNDPQGDAIVATLAAEDVPRECDDPTPLGDDRLRLIFTCCHPALAQSAQVALALRTLCRLETREIARAFVEPEATTAQKLVRAKRKIATAGIPYEVPSANELPERLATVLAVVYFVFNEGYAATDDANLLRPDLCIEAIRLGRLIADLLPEEPEALGLLALLLFHDSRHPARTDASGALVPLETQDRNAWNRAYIDEGLAVLDRAVAMRAAGPYQIQAAIAALHAKAATAEHTDWVQISALYGALLRHQPTPVVELNAAVAHAMAKSIPEGLEWIDRIAQRHVLDDYHLLHAARADLLRRCGNLEAAACAYRAAIGFVANPKERDYLARRLREVTPRAN